MKRKGWLVVAGVLSAAVLFGSGEESPDTVTVQTVADVQCQKGWHLAEDGSCVNPRYYDKEGWQERYDSALEQEQETSLRDKLKETVREASADVREIRETTTPASGEKYASRSESSAGTSERSAPRKASPPKLDGECSRFGKAWVCVPQTSANGSPVVKVTSDGWARYADKTRFNPDSGRYVK